MNARQQIEDIEHRNTKVRSPHTNGFVERMTRTLLDDCFRVKGRENFYLTIQEIQRDLDEFSQALGLDSLPNLDFGSLDSVPETNPQEDAIITVTV